LADIRILHTADVHLGAPFEFLGVKGEEHRGTIRATFSKITDMARSEGYDVLIIAGDLFDSAYSVREADLSFAVNCIAEAAASCPVVILPGSHDYWAPGSVYEREADRLESVGGVHLFTPSCGTIEIPEISLALHAKALTSPHTDEDALSGITASGDFRWNLAVAHGSVTGASAADPGENPIDLDRLEEGFDYVALGHWHSFNELKRSGTPAVYCGSPELVARDQRGAGHVVSVALGSEGVVYERIRVGKRSVETCEADCTGITTTEELVRAILERTDPGSDDVLELILTGVIGAGSALDLDQAVDMLERSCFSVLLAGSGPSHEVSGEELARIPQQTVAGRFVRLLQERILEADGDRRAVLEEALQKGYQLFLGRDPF